MTSGQLNQVLRQLCRLAGAGSVAELSDRRLLEAFIAQHDPAAFEVLVQRHGPLVLGVCRRVLHDEHDADDAFQACFMVLARKASSIRRQESVASWLCGTAYRIALKARAAASRRRDQERQAAQMAPSAVENESLWRELRPISIACPRNTGLLWCSATCRARPMRPPPASSAGRPAPCPIAWPKHANGCEPAWSSAASP